MGEDQEFKHVCKFCSKSFQCGRSLGGHMGSHIINNIDEKQLDTNQESTGYGLRENPKKTWRFTDHSTGDFGKFCKECGKSFQSLKALCGHMKCHSSEKDKTSHTNSFEDTKLGLDSKSDDETDVLIRRSKRITRYCMMTPANSSLSWTCASSSATQEQEEVAMCLIMLSKDTRNWGRFDLVAEPSDNNSVSLDAPSSNRTSKNTSEIMKQKGIEPEICASGVSKTVSTNRMNETEDFVDTIEKKGNTEKLLLELGKHVTKKTRPDQASHDSSKRKFSDHFDPDSSRRNASDSKCFNSSSKRNRFECTSCNKIFHSYQALGGHRASHRKIKGCFASGINSSIETADRSSVEHFIKDCDNRTEISVKAEKRSEGHECSICFKVFSSGQALGGHKRSHSVHQQPSTEIGNFIDLNFPSGPDEAENNEEGVEYKRWWIGTIHA